MNDDDDNLAYEDGKNWRTDGMVSSQMLGFALLYAVAFLGLGVMLGLYFWLR